MLRSEDHVRLRHMLDASERAIGFCHGKTRQDLEGDDMLCLALVRLLEIIGEAAKSVSAELKEEFADIPWRQIAGTRDRLIHGYFNVDLDIVWSILSNDLPPLVTELKKIV